ncbi:MAG: DsbA family protein [Burkholderiaceae bacterium]
MDWYFDFISPYAYLQCERMQRTGMLDQVVPVPLLFAGLLDHWGNLGPAEVAPKRLATFRQIIWRAACDDIALTLPPRHPFNPLPLLRASQALGNRPEVVRRLFRFVWAEGRDPDDGDALAALMAELGLAPSDIGAPAVKAALRSNGERAVAAGVFGVPTLVVDDQVFWGDDATDMARAYLQSRADAGPAGAAPAWPAEAMHAAQSLPEGPARPGLRRHFGAGRDGVAEAPGQGSRPGNQPGPGHANAAGPRIPLLPLDLADPADLVAQVRARRGGHLLELDRLLLYSPPLTEGWNHMLGNVRTKLSVERKLRELAMCVVAKVNRADYEFAQHAPLWREAGATEAQIAAVADPDAAWRDPAVFDELERAAIRLALEMTRDVQVSDDAFKACHRQLGEQGLVEFVGVVAAYNMVSRFLVAFELHP